MKEPDPAHVVLEEHGNDEFEHSIASPALHLAHFETTEANTFKLVMYQLEDFEISNGGKTLATQTLLSGQKALTLASDSWHSFKVERVSVEKPTTIRGGTRAKTPDREDIEAVAEEFAQKDHGGLDPDDAETIEALNAAVRLRIGKVSPEALKEFKMLGRKGNVGVAGTAGAGSAGTSTGQGERKKTVPESESADDEDEHDEDEQDEPESTEPDEDERGWTSLLLGRERGRRGHRRSKNSSANVQKHVVSAASVFNMATVSYIPECAMQEPMLIYKS